MKKRTTQWVDSRYYKIFIAPLNYNSDMPRPEDYGISVTVLEDYLKKMQAVDDKFSYGEKKEGIDSFLFKQCLYFSWIIIVALGLIFGNAAWVLWLGGGLVVAFYFVTKHIYHKKYDKALSAIKIPCIEEYIEAVWKWRETKQNRNLP